ncbi:MAG: SPOR domain-containing protein, partial [Candidatus Binatia bacterium]
ATGDPAEREMTFYDTLTGSPSRVEAEAAEKEKGDKIKGRAVKAEGKRTNQSVKGEVIPAPKKAMKKAGSPARKLGRIWSVQVNAFASLKDARSLARGLRSKGYEAYVVSTMIKGRVWHRVRVGRLATRDQAKRLLQTLKEKYAGAIIAGGG